MWLIKTLTSGRKNFISLLISEPLLLERELEEYEPSNELEEDENDEEESMWKIPPPGSDSSSYGNMCRIG